MNVLNIPLSKSDVSAIDSVLPLIMKGSPTPMKKENANGMESPRYKPKKT